MKEEEGKERVVKALIRRVRGGRQERLLADSQFIFGGRCAAVAGIRIQAPEKGATA